MDRAQQAVVDAAVAGTCLRQPRIDGFQVPADFRSEDLEQDRVDMGDHGVRHGGGRDGFACTIRRDCRRRVAGGVEQHVLTGGEPVGDGGHRGDVEHARGFAAQRGEQLRQHGAGLGDERHHRVTGGPRAIEHAVEHVLDVPAELAERLGADQPATALQGVEHAADRAQQLAVFGRALPRRQQAIQVGDFLLELFEEDFADFIVYFIADFIEASAEQGHVALHADRGSGFDRFGRLRGLVRSGIRRRRDFGRCSLTRQGRNPVVRQRPITQLLQADAGLVEQVLALAMRIAQRFQVVLHPRQRIGQRVQLAPAGHLLVAKQLGMAEAPQRLEVTRRLRQVEDAHRTRHFRQQARDRIQHRMVPVGLDEGDEGVADFGEIRRGLARQRTHHLAGFLRQLVVGLDRVAAAEPAELVVQRMFDVDQRAGDFHQVAIAGFAAAIGEPLHHLALFLDDAPGAFQSQHAQRLADAIQRLGLWQQVGEVAATRAQVQVECVLDPQQVFLQRRGHGVEQGAVASCQAAARMLQFRLGRFDQQAGQCVLLHRFHPARHAQVVDQRQQHDRDVAVAALQALQVIRQLHHAAHQRRQGVVAISGGALEQGTGQLFHLAGHHRRGLQLQHAQGALHLVQVAGTSAHRRCVRRVFDEGLDLEPRLAQGLVDLGLHPTERGVVDCIAQRRGHREAPLRPRSTGLA